MNNYQDELIGMLIIKPTLFATSILEANFFDKKHRNIFNAIKRSYLKNKTVIVEDIINDKNVDIDLFTKLSMSAASTANFNYYQEYAIIEYKKKAIINNAKKLANNDMELNDFYKNYNDIISLNTYKSNRLNEKILQEAVTTNKKSIKFTKFLKLEKKLNLKENDFVVLAGKTGGGKSGLALNLLNDLSNNYQCVYFNLEMVKEELYQRLITINSTYTQQKIEQYELLPQNELLKVNNAIKSIAKRKIDIINHSITLDKFRSYIAAYKSDGHFIVFIDHIGLIGTRSRNAYERMTEVAKELRKISLDYDCTIIGLCQLNRDAVKNNPKPSLSMLRDSGEIEQSASKVIFMWGDDDNYSIVSEKNRSAPKSIVNIGYNKSNQIVYELDSYSKDIRN